MSCATKRYGLALGNCMREASDKIDILNVNLGSVKTPNNPGEMAYTIPMEHHSRAVFDHLGW